ncbi:sigma-E processing peptidase SpoIIGA [Proteinivorax hydrogeniformans]|uniref:Sporulation sigma-E factor-processing peptidase n=1 Tax=Proteinivorax hydrogeniformans TaxID=1826727 RepID=A0AAU8HR62_9FIRM
MTLYLDLTLILNGIVCWIAFSITEFVLNTSARKIRKLLASVIGSCYLVAFLFWYNFANNIFMKITIVIMTVLVCFGYTNFKRLLAQTSCVILFTATFSGFLYMGLNSLVGQGETGPNPFIDIKNFWYVFIFLALFVIIPPFFRVFIVSVKKLSNAEKMSYKVQVWLRGKAVNLKGFVDTGNTLVDPVSKLPIIILDRKALKGVLSDKWDRWLEVGDSWNVPNDGFNIRYAPINTIGGTSLMVILKPQKVYLITKDSKEEVLALVGVNPHKKDVLPGFDALIHPNVLANVDNL